MQGISKYLRWSPLYTCCCVFIILSTTVTAVPVRPRRMVRDTFAFDAVNSNTISNATCINDGIEVQKSSVKCEIKTGCRLIQKTGECCPEYQCDCNHEDRTYDNGDKIVSNDPCRRCVCKGGEVTCNDVSCYIRDDCKPRYLPGVCCPQYDNCPPIDDIKIATAKETDKKSPSKNDVIISLATTTTAAAVGTGTPPSDEKNPLLQLAKDNPLGIKIKEITKPEEIRITDDKPKPFNPFKSTTTAATKPTPTTTTTTTAIAPTTSATTETTLTSTESTESSSDAATRSLSTESTSINSNTISTTETPKETSTVDTNQLSNANEHESRDYMDDGILLSEDSSAAPSTKASAEGEVEPQLLLAGADSNSIGDESGSKSVRQTTENGTFADWDQSSENIYLSSTTEIGTESSTPLTDISSTESSEQIDLASAVSSTPKNLVVVRQGGKTESFHISGTDGLQRVEELEVLSSTTEAEVISPSSSEDTFFISTEILELKFSEEMLSSTTAGPEEFDNVTVALTVDDLSKLSENNAENVTSGANSSTEVSTESSSSESSSSLSSTEQVYETVYYPESTSPSTEGPPDTVWFGSSEDTFINDGSSTTMGPDVSSSSESVYSTTMAPVSVTEGRFSFEEEDNTPAENPEYPPIPDDLSLHHKEIEEEEKRRLPSKVLAEELPLASSTVGPCDGCDIAKSAEVSSTQGPSMEDEKMSHKDDKIEYRAPGEPHLVPEWERTTTQNASNTEENLTTLGPSPAAVETTTVAAVNDINKTTIFDKVASKLNKSEPLTLETIPNDVSSEEKYGRKEPTTERPTTKGYPSIESEEGSTSTSSEQSEFDSMVDGIPDDDVESIKKVHSGGDDSESHESYSQGAPAVPNAFQNYFKFLETENEKNGGWNWNWKL